MLKTPKHKYGMGWRPQRPDYRDYRYEDLLKVALAPEAIPATSDNSKLISRVRDQDGVGCCVGEGMCYLFESRQIALRGFDFEASVMYEYRNARILSKTFPGDNGAHVRDGLKATAKYGMCPVADWPFAPNQIDAPPPEQCAIDAIKAKSTNYYFLDSPAGTAQTLLHIKDALSKGLLVAFGSPVYQQIEEVDPKTGIIDMPGSSNPEIGGHCMTLMGHDDSTGYFSLVNSWGERWGKAFTGFKGKRFKGGMGYWNYKMVLKALATDHAVIAMESEINP